MTALPPPNSPVPDYEAPSSHAGSVGHVVPFGLLLKVFLALVCLTILTFTASMIDFGEFNLIVALAIAIAKSSLVVLFFMHLRWDKPFNSIVFIGCLIFVGLFISLTLLDSNQYRGSVIVREAPAVHHIPLKPETPAP